jgi:hypothetical protein
MEGGKENGANCSIDYNLLAIGLKTKIWVKKKQYWLKLFRILLKALQLNYGIKKSITL